jgi:putative phosphoesterase
VTVAAFDGEITTGIHDRFVSVIKADQVGRRSALASDFDDHAVPVGGSNRPAVHNDPVALGCLHGNHLQPQITTPGRAGKGRAWQDLAMPLNLLLLADTHVPKRARALPAQVWAAVESSDVVFHAGDWVTAELLDQLEQRSHALVGVYGNNDGPDLRSRLPETAEVTLEGVRFAMVHETGQAKGREARSEKLYPDADVLVFGHSHIPWDSTSNRGLRLLNPGSPTDRRRQPACTYMTAVVDAGALRDVRLVEVHRDGI